ncbi:MAG: single-stranded DNA-binding protein [Anaerolineales bacterium]|jgi:single-strand DNA-binding protein|nr:single-stranded DNA-binding protein [Anaerolineales bacterium]
MPALNRVQLIGNLGKDPESRFTPKGRKYCRFTLAVNRQWKNDEGEVKEHTEWFNIEAWDRLGEICQEYLHKGSLVFLEGRLQTDRYEHEGETRFITKVVLQSMQMLDRKASSEEEAPLEETDLPE